LAVLITIILITIVVMPVRAAYVAGFSGAPTNGPSPLTVQFTDLSSGAPTSWYWDFGDRTTDETQNPSHIYTNPGAYSVRLTVTGRGGTDSNLQIGYIVVDAPTPIPTDTTATPTGTLPLPIKAGFSGSPTSGTAPLNVTFSDVSTGSPTSWKWDFGDGGSSSIKNPSHTYTVPGSYSVSLHATGPGGTNVKSLTDYITVTGSMTPVLTQIPESLIRNDNTAAIPTSTPYPVISKQPTLVRTPAVQNDQIGVSLLYAMIIVVIVVIMEITAIIIYHRNRDKERRG
jgi:PKD repeat protein